MTVKNWAAGAAMALVVLTAGWGLWRPAPAGLAADPSPTPSAAPSYAPGSGLVMVHFFATW